MQDTCYGLQAQLRADDHLGRTEKPEGEDGSPAGRYDKVRRVSHDNPVPLGQLTVYPAETKAQERP